MKETYLAEVVAAEVGIAEVEDGSSGWGWYAAYSTKEVSASFAIMPLETNVAPRASMAKSRPELTAPLKTREAP